MFSGYIYSVQISISTLLATFTPLTHSSYGNIVASVSRGIISEGSYETISFAILQAGTSDHTIKSTPAAL
jgi:hypothetical protein